MKKLSERQRTVLDFIIDAIEDRGCAPTISEIQTGCGYRHSTPVAKVLLALETKRYIAREARKHRAITVIRAAF